MLAKPFLLSRIMKSFVTACELPQQTSPRFWMNLVQLYFNRSHIQISLECTLLTFTTPFVATCLWKRVAKAEIQEHYEAFFFFFKGLLKIWVLGYFLQKHKMQKLSICFSADWYIYAISSKFSCIQFLRPLMKESNFMCGASTEYLKFT